MIIPLAIPFVRDIKQRTAQLNGIVSFAAVVKVDQWATFNVLLVPLVEIDLIFITLTQLNVSEEVVTDPRHVAIALELDPELVDWWAVLQLIWICQPQLSLLVFENTTLGACKSDLFQSRLKPKL